MSDRSRRILRWGGLVVVLVIAFFTLRGKLPDPRDLWTALGTAHLWWIVVAVLAESASMRHFALQQRRLLAGFGVDMSLPRALAITYTRSAMSISLPAGSAVSAGYAFRQFRGVGAGRRVAAAVMLLSGLLSVVALVIMYGLVVLADHVGLPSGAGNTAIGVMVWTTLGVALVLFVVDYYVLRHGCTPTGTTAREEEDLPDEVTADTRRQRLARSVGRTLTTLRDLPARAWLGSLAHATVNWATDFACLAATSAAFDLHIGVTRLATVYVTVQLVRQVPISPGGIGVIEVSLLAGLISAGAGQAPAAAAMLVYRLISCWLIIPAGAIAYATLRASTDSATMGEIPPDRVSTGTAAVGGGGAGGASSDRVLTGGVSPGNAPTRGAPVGSVLAGSASTGDASGGSALTGGVSGGSVSTSGGVSGGGASTGSGLGGGAAMGSVSGGGGATGGVSGGVGSTGGGASAVASGEAAVVTDAGSLAASRRRV